MNFEEISKDIQDRKLLEGFPTSVFQSKRLAAQEIASVFNTIGGMREYLKVMKEFGGKFTTGLGYTVNTETLQSAVDMFFPSQAEDRESMKELYDWG